MTWLRRCFVLMLVVLLPLRGAVAAAMPCPPASPNETGVMQAQARATQGHHHDDAHGHGSPHQDGHAPQVGPHTPHGVHHGGASHHGVTDGKCNLCAASCSLTTLLGDAPTILEPPVARAAPFPALSAPAPNFLSTGQERPPRSI